VIYIDDNQNIKENEFGVGKEVYNIRTKDPTNYTSFIFININCKLGHVVGLEEYARHDAGPFVKRFEQLVERLIEIDKQHYQKMLFTAWLTDERAINRIAEHFPLVSRTTLPIGYNNENMHFCVFRFNLTKDYASIKLRLDKMMGLTSDNNE
jgi:hypothetical protein